MRSIKAKLSRTKAAASPSNDDWSKLDQRVWHAVAMDQPAKLFTKLSKHEVNINKLCPNVGYSIVHYAASKGLDDCLNVLLQNKADISTKDITGATPLHVSSRYGHRGTTTKLLASSTVEVNARDNNHYTALHFAAFQGHLDCVVLIADHPDSDINCINKDGRTALMVAAAMGRQEVCLELLKRGIDVNHRDTSELNHSAITLAAEAGHAEVVRMLCENGADYGGKLSDGRNALEVARSRSRRAVVDVLHVIQLADAAKKQDPRNARKLSGSQAPLQQQQQQQLQHQQAHNDNSSKSKPTTTSPTPKTLVISKHKKTASVETAGGSAATSSAASSSSASSSSASTARKVSESGSSGVVVMKKIPEQQHNKKHIDTSQVPYADGDQQKQHKQQQQTNSSNNKQQHRPSHEGISTSHHQHAKHQQQHEAPQAASSTTTQATQALYNDSRSMVALYDRDVSMYDSRSTLASVSSLDASVVTDPAPKSSTSSGGEHSKQQFARLADELAHVKEHNAALKQRLRQHEHELDGLRTASASFQHSMQVLEKDNVALAGECKHLRETYEKLTIEYNDSRGEVADLVKLNQRIDAEMNRAETMRDEARSKLDGCARTEKMLRAELELSHAEAEKLRAEVARSRDDKAETVEALERRLVAEESGREEEVKRGAEERGRLEVELKNLTESMEKERAATEASNKRLVEILLQHNKEEEEEEASGDGGHQLSEHIKQNPIEATQVILEKGRAIRKAKRVESEESAEARSKAVSEADLLRTKIIEQEKEMTLLNSMLAKNEQELARLGEENSSLVVMLEQARDEVEELRSSNHRHSTKATRSQEELSAMKKQASVSKMSFAKLENELTTTSAERVKLERAVKEIEERHAEELSELRDQLAAALEEQGKSGDLHKKLLEHEKTIGELRRERNQREARVCELEKWAGKEETKRKEVEVEVNRIRQQLTEARHNNAHLTAEVGTPTGTHNNHNQIVLKTA